MRLNQVEKWFLVGFAGFCLLLAGGLAYLTGKGNAPATINVRCIGDHLLFESERTGDIQVIPNKCKKTYPKSQAPVTK